MYVYQHTLTAPSQHTLTAHSHSTYPQRTVTAHSLHVCTCVCKAPSHQSLHPSSTAQFPIEPSNSILSEFVGGTAPHTTTTTTVANQTLSLLPQTSNTPCTLCPSDTSYQLSHPPPLQGVGSPIDPHPSMNDMQDFPQPPGSLTPFSQSFN